MPAFDCPEIAQLFHELTLSPLRHRLRQLSGIARAIELIDPDRGYPFSFVCYQITGYRPKRAEEVLLDGKIIISDLSHLAEDLTRISPIPISSSQGALYTVDALAGRFRVSTKTISRWRRRGLMGCWYDEGDSEKQLAFSSHIVQRFVSHHLELVQRGRSFSLMNPREQAQVVARAREIVAAAPCSLHRVTLTLAEETGRAVETIRQTLRRYDFDHQDQALFDQTEKANQIDENEVIYQAFVDGESAEALAARFGRRTPEIRQILRQLRASEVSSQPINYVYHHTFDAPEADARMPSPMPPVKRQTRQAKSQDILSKLPAGLPAYLKALYRTPLLGRAEEQHLFCRMNYLLHEAELIRRRIAKDPAAATEEDLAELEDRLSQAAGVKNHITQANLRLVVSIAKRHLHYPSTVDRSGLPHASHPSEGNRQGLGMLFELISDGNVALIRAVEKFDFSKGFHFSTYASWVIKRSFARSVPEEITHSSRFRTGHETILASLPDNGRGRQGEDLATEEIRSVLGKGLSTLDHRERAILERHYGLAGIESSWTLTQIGDEIGLSKERVRQIEQRALTKLRDLLGERGPELLAG